MKFIISEEQSGFVKERQIMDVVLVANETVDHQKRNKKRGYILKVDFEKAFDAKISALVNGSPTDEVSLGWGLRQGNPLSPFLFIIVTEELHQIISNAKRLDIMENLMVLKRLLRCFELMSSHKVNFHKSTLVGIDIDDDEVNRMAKRLYCKTGKLPIIYLGMPFGGTLAAKILSLGDMEGHGRIHNIAWENIAKPKDRGGAGASNLADKNGCGDLTMTKISDSLYGSKCFKKSIIFLRNVQDLLNPTGGRVEHAIREGLAFSLGNGKKIMFWEDIWIGDLALKDKYQRLYMVSNLHNLPIDNFGVWDGLNWNWSLSWRRELLSVGKSPRI
ncbi:uncharacterized protein LOC119986904 [Tripterygium wilfordii]|uniref:uncharacterized protein LOC119986904 n=1 Tax=Tripterygium wilfordii TaxID=458696 RepID=UPI0018F85A60|nr:uncharacterized protein LOC119986904 [Tripterygium wilfordii]